MRRFAISGKARAGKNTVADMMVRQMGLTEGQFKIDALADPMKHIAETMFPEADKKCLYGASELRSTPIAGTKYLNAVEEPLTYRQFLIDLGAFGRRYNRDLWLNALVEHAKTNQTLVAHIVADVRFVNEFEYFKRAGYHLIRVKRTAHALIDDKSELEQDQIPDTGFDTVIENNGSMNELQARVAEMFAVASVKHTID